MASTILKFITLNAYWLCLFACLGGTIAHIAGFKKGGRVAVLSLIVYWVVAAICSTK